MESIERRINNLHKLNEIIVNKLEDVEIEIYNLEKTYNRNKKDNANMFFIENREIAIECFKYKKLEELYSFYCEWCKKYRVKAMYYAQFVKSINAIAQKHIPLEDLMKFPTIPNIISKFCSLILKSAEKGNTIPQTTKQAKTYCYSIFPNADKTLVWLFENFADKYQNLYHAKKDLETELKNISREQVKEVGRIIYEEK